MKSASFSSQFNGLFILYISKAKPLSLVREYTDMKINDHEIWYSTFTKLWQSCSNPHLKIRPIAIFAFYFLNYSLAARLQDNSRPKSPTKVETKSNLQQFTVSGWLIMNGGESGNEIKENFKVEITFNMKRQYSY